MGNDASPENTETALQWTQQANNNRSFRFALIAALGVEIALVAGLVFFSEHHVTPTPKPKVISVQMVHLPPPPPPKPVVKPKPTPPKPTPPVPVVHRPAPLPIRPPVPPRTAQAGLAKANASRTDTAPASDTAAGQGTSLASARLQRGEGVRQQCTQPRQAERAYWWLDQADALHR